MVTSSLGCAGGRTTTVVQIPTSLSTDMVPWCRSTVLPLAGEIGVEYPAQVLRRNPNPCIGEPGLHDAPPIRVEIAR